MFAETEVVSLIADGADPTEIARGLDVFALGEHHRPDFVSSAPSVILAAAAARTQNIRLSSAVTVLSSDDPIRVFQQFATLDLLSQGRAEIMAGRGSFTESFPLFGQDLQDYDSLVVGDDAHAHAAVVVGEQGAPLVFRAYERRVRIAELAEKSVDRHVVQLVAADRLGQDQDNLIAEEKRQHSAHQDCKGDHGHALA